MDDSIILEWFPLLVAGMVALLGALLIFDAWTPDDIVVRNERRRRPRRERSRGGEATLGFGVLCIAAAIAGRDTWAYTLVSVIAGAVLIVIGGFANRGFIAEVIGNRGPLRRRDG